MPLSVLTKEDFLNPWLEKLNLRASQMGVETGYEQLKEPTVLNDQEELKLFHVVSKSGQARSNAGND